MLLDTSLPYGKRDNWKVNELKFMEAFWAFRQKVQYKSKILIFKYEML